MRNWTALTLAITLGFAFAGCEGEQAGAATGEAPTGEAPMDAPIVDAPTVDAPTVDAPTVQAPIGEVVPGVSFDEHGEPAGLHRYHKWSERVGQGAGPMGEVAFRNLKALGYGTVLSVDGSLPDVELAGKYSLRYVHVPIGYDGIPTDAALQIIKAVKTSEAPIYVHCHHGKHRGPAAAMICRLAEDGITREQAVEGLEVSGTSPNYKGLWQSVREFRVPTEDELAEVSDDLPSRVQPEGLRANMVRVSYNWENLILSKKSGWKKPKDHPDVDPPHEARMLWELFREMARVDTECKAQGQVFVDYLGESEKATIELEKAIRAGDLKAADRQFKVVKDLCSACHRDHRN